MAEWRVISSLEGRYEINEEGVVRHRRTGKLLTPDKNGIVRSSWGLGKEGEKFCWGRSVASLMEEAFPFHWIKELEDGEEAKPISGFPGYFITSWGRVYSLHNNKWLKLAFRPPYYYNFYLFQDGKKRKCHSHTLVGRNFLPEWREGLFILHRDETLPFPEINFPENLWVGSQKDNVRDAVRKGRQKGWCEGRGLVDE